MITKELEAAVFHALTKTCNKHAERDNLAAGGTYDVRGSFIGRIRDENFNIPFDMAIAVGQDEDKPHTGPTASKIAAYLMGKLNPATRAAVLRDLPALYADEGELKVEKKDAEDCKVLMQNLRLTKIVTARGKVTCKGAAELQA